LQKESQEEGEKGNPQDFLPWGCTEPEELMRGEVESKEGHDEEDAGGAGQGRDNRGAAITEYGGREHETGEDGKEGKEKKAEEDTLSIGHDQKQTQQLE